MVIVLHHFFFFSFFPPENFMSWWGVDIGFIEGGREGGGRWDLASRGFRAEKERGRRRRQMGWGWVSTYKINR